ncbi:carbohydrate ABC transporter permease [Sphingomonas sp. RB1R13]|uniref:carbohydrate ABC transporter permease n=1 Tax=Sphingomonas sp. RB1R13 TaxID=3096159 RepID=UPI002FCA638D
MKQVRSASGFAFVAPFLLLYAFLQLYPLVRGIIISLHRVDLFGGGHFVGLANYGEILGDPVFGQAVVNTLLVTLMIVPPLTVLALLLALALNNATRSSAIYRGLFFSSSVLSVTIVTLIWRFVLAPDSGLVGEALKATGHEPLPFLSDAHLVLPAIALTTIWWSIGLPMILFLAGLQQIPADMYEAAALDRSSRWTTLRKITLPAIRRTTLLVVMLQTASQLQLFGQSQLLTAGGPGGASRTMVFFIYETAFVRWQLGYAAAGAEILFVMILMVTLIQYVTINRDREEAR